MSMEMDFYSDGEDITYTCDYCGSRHMVMDNNSIHDVSFMHQVSVGPILLHMCEMCLEQRLGFMASGGYSYVTYGDARPQHGRWRKT